MMKKDLLLPLLFLLLLGSGFFQTVSAQDIVHVNLQQQDPALEVTMSYDRTTTLNRKNLYLDRLKYQRQYVYVTVTNKTQDVLSINVDFFAERFCGYDAGYGIGSSNGGDYLKPGQTLTKKFNTDLGELGKEDCSPVDIGNGQYSYIKSVRYSIKKIYNHSEAERKELARQEAAKKEMQAQLDAEKARQEALSKSQATSSTTGTSAGASKASGNKSATAKTSAKGAAPAYSSTPAASSNTASSAAAKQAAVDEAMANIARQQAAAEARQRQQSEAIGQAIDGVSTMAIGIMNDINATRERNEANARRRAEERAIRDKSNAEKGDVLLQFYLADAMKGDEEAIAKVAEAYTLKKEENNRLSFLTDRVKEHNSQVAINTLTKHYTNITKDFRNREKKSRAKGIKMGVGALAVGIGGVVGANAINEPTVSAITGTVGIFGGGALALFSFVNIVTASSHYGHPDYENAVEKLSQLEKLKKVSFAPAYNLPTNTPGLSMQFRF